MKAPLVTILDDEPAIRSMLSDALEEAGGSRDDFEKERRAGARSEGSEELQRCVEAELADKETPTNADKATALQTCEDEAKDAFLVAGGEDKAWKQNERKGAAEQVAAALEACVEKEAPENAGERATAVAGCKPEAEEIAAELGVGGTAEAAEAALNLGSRAVARVAGRATGGR